MHVNGTFSSPSRVPQMSLVLAPSWCKPFRRVQSTMALMRTQQEKVAPDGTRTSCTSLLRISVASQKRAAKMPTKTDKEPIPMNATRQPWQQSHQHTGLCNQLITHTWGL